MKNISCTCLLFILLQFNGLTQTTIQDYHTRKQQITARGMTALTTWSIANMAIGAYQGFNLPKNKDKYFNQMNMYWNLVNLPIGLLGLIKSKKEKAPNSWEEMRQFQKSIEKTYLINAGLDVCYVASGATLMLVSDNSTQPELLKGMGESIIFQGVFLLAFDLFEFGLHKAHRKKDMPDLKQL